MAGWKEKLGLATIIVAPTAYAAWLLFFPFSKLMVLPLVPAAALVLFKHFHPDAFFRRMAGSCFAVSAASVAVPAARLSYQARDLKFGFAVEPGSVWVAAVGLLATVGFGLLELRRRSEGKQPQGPPPPNGGNTLNVTSGGKVEAGNIVFGDQHIHNDKTSGQALDAIEKLVDHGVLDAADDQLTALERTSWLLMVPAEKYRHRKLQGRVLGGRGQNAAAADRFMEAADFVPTDEKAQVLRAHALMMRGDLEGAHELSTRLVAQHPSLAAAKAAWITSAPKSARADDLLGKPWDALAPEVASALADRLLDESRPKEALEVLQRAHSPGVKLGYWSTYSIALLKYHEQLGLENGPPELLTEAMTALEKANKLCAGESFKAGKVLILLNIGYVHRLRGDLDEEWRVLREAHDLDSGHRDVRIRIAKVLVDRGRLDEAIAMFEDLAGDGPDYVPFLLGVALAKRGKSGDVERAAELFEQTAALADATEPALRLDGAEAYVKVCRKLKLWDRALAACRTFAGVLGAFRAKHLEASIHLERGDSASAQRVLLEAAALELTPTQRETIGVLFVHAGDNDHAIELLEPVAPRTEWTESTAALITAAQATERDELTIRVCRQLRAAGVARNSIADAEAAALHRRGELGAAIEVVEEFLSSREDPFLRLRLSTLGIAAQRPELIERDPARLPQPHDGDPHVAVVAVGVLRAAGVHDAAIRYAYDAYRAHRSSPEGWAAILEAFNPVSGPKNHVQPEVVSPDAAVLFREGQNRRWIIVEPREPKAEHDEFSPDAPLVVAMLGKRVGESFELRRETALPRTYVVEEILSKYVRAYHRCLEQWEEQFPDVPGPIMIEVPENLAEDIEGFTKQLMPLLEKRARHVTELEHLYETKPLTLHMLASGLGGSVVGAMSHLITATKLDVRCTRIGMEEAREVLTALDGGQKVILETSALSTLFLLGETELFGALRGRIAIAQATLDELRAYRREVEKSGDGSLGVHDGRLTMIEYDQASRAKHLGVVDALLESATEWEVFHEKEHDRFTPDEWDRLVNIGGSGAVESLHRAMRTGEPVWCDDMMLALVANERGVRVAWTQLMCHYLLLHSELESEQAHRISAKLVGCRFVKTNTTPGIYLEAARLAKWNPDHWPLSQHLRLFEVEGWSEHATGLLAVTVLREWWRHAPSDAIANALTVALLDRIAARSNGTTLIPAIRGVLERAFGVDVLSYQRARAVFDSWARARPLRQSVLG